ncbi:MAG: cytochrome B [Betaproteobacteria bacterium RIFCSPLOWO2_12_FULL_62_58]|nr:MAG: cytochrome B [Betaproteobacteria bacterium RIFCSPLOWO2_12_FULL_62_58]
MARVYIFKRFERFWHWTQAALIVLMLLTGFEVHGTYLLFGWEKAANLHTTAAWTLIGLWVFAIFWHFTPGEWKQYIPTTDRILAVMRYYVVGIFTDAPHPFRVTRLSKHNPLQRLAYLMVKLFINPLIWVSGLLYLYYNDLATSGIAALAGLTLGAIALVHTAAAFMMLVFLTGHIYLATTGHTPLAHIKAMITGWEDLDHEPGREPSQDGVRGEPANAS